MQRQLVVQGDRLAATALARLRARSVRRERRLARQLLRLQRTDMDITQLMLIDLIRSFDVVNHHAPWTKLKVLQIFLGGLESCIHGHVHKFKIGYEFRSPYQLI